jgi:hypothetical protein
LHSILQNEPGGWSVFHSAHIIHIAEAIDKVLPPGYIVAPERSLQIREFDPDTGERIYGRKSRSRRPDIVVYDTDPSAERPGIPERSPTAPTLTVEHIEEVDDPELYLTAAVIHEMNGDGTLGRPVTWVELLSPSNKPTRAGYVQYREKRIAALRNSIVMVEIDYLHQSQPINDHIPSYPDREDNAYPYTISVTDLRVTPELEAFGFKVDAKMPIINVPLSGKQIITLDFGEVYNQSFESFGIYGYQVDYEQEPVRFDTYREDDQQRIRARMQAVMQAHQQGKDLEQGPFEVES